MSNMYITFFLLLMSVYASAQESMQLIGVDMDSSPYGRSANAVKDNQEERQKEIYAPYRTIAFYRKGDSILIRTVPYLLIPTKTRFLYCTLSVTEIRLDKEAGYDFSTEGYELDNSFTRPRFFESRQSIEQFLSMSKPEFTNALHTDYEKLTFITPDFFITQGFTSDVHGGASGFSANEETMLYSMQPFYKPKKNLLMDYVSRQQLTDIIINTVTGMEELGTSEVITPAYTLPWSGPIGEFEEVYFALRFMGSGIKVIPLTRIRGNSSKSFLAEGIPLQNDKLLQELGLEPQNAGFGGGDTEFLWADGSTKTVVDGNALQVIDIPSGRELASYNAGIYNNIVMSEYALGKYCKTWFLEME